jgi:hypothetical protein
MSLLGAVTPTYWWNPGLNWSWLWRKSGQNFKNKLQLQQSSIVLLAYSNHNSPFMSIVPFLSGEPILYTNSLEVTQQVLQAESKLGLAKPVELMASLLQVPFPAL